MQYPPISSYSSINNKKHIQVTLLFNTAGAEYSITAAMTSVSPSISDTPTSSSPDSLNLTKQKGKRGRPNQWSTPRRRQLARLYAFTTLPREDIPRVLKDRTNEWLPGKESTTKTVNAILGPQPRWLRPKDRMDMDKKIQELDQCKKDRKKRQRWKSTHDSTLVSNELQAEFSDRQLDDMQLDDIIADFSETFPSVVGEQTQHQGPYITAFDARRDSFVLPMDPAHINDWDAVQINSAEETCRWSMSEAGSLTSTRLSIRSLQARLSNYSITYVKAVARVLKSHSITNSSLATCSVRYADVYQHDDDGLDALTIRAASTIRERSFRNQSLLLPASILVLAFHIRDQGLCLTGLKAHDTEACWCRVEQQARGRIWDLDEDGALTYPSQRSANTLDDMHPKDAFGNTLLHLLTARDPNYRTILDTVQCGFNINATNSAGQTFLHTLTSTMMITLARDRHILDIFLWTLNVENVDWTKRDVFGRTFLHLLTRTAKQYSENALHTFIGMPIDLPSQRDAFGWEPDHHSWLPYEDACPRDDMESQVEELWSPSSPFCDEQFPTPMRSSSSCHEQQDSLSVFRNHLNDPTAPRYHTELLSIATASMRSRNVMDSLGRNGLQCLAEADLSIGCVANKPSRKRKYGQGDERFALRYESVVSLIANGVDVNNYDSSGTTVLMAFVMHMKDDEDDAMLAKTLRYLINQGANVHWRNRLGETALHIGVRLGRTKATQVLLESGANVHARTSKGQGVLSVARKHSKKAREDSKLYGCIMACMALCITHGAIASPTLVDEWSELENIGVAF